MRRATADCSTVPAKPSSGRRFELAGQRHGNLRAMPTTLPSPAPQNVQVLTSFETSYVLRPKNTQLPTLNDDQRNNESNHTPRCQKGKLQKNSVLVGYES